MMYGGSFPAVLKVGHAHAGFGKMKVPNHRDWEDVRSVVAMTDGQLPSSTPPPRLSHRQAVFLAPTRDIPLNVRTSSVS